MASACPAGEIPIVDYLVLAPEPCLVANACVDCGARFFDRRNACAACGGASFVGEPVSPVGEVRAFTIVMSSGSSIPVPFVAAIVDCDGTAVRANLVGVVPDPSHVRLGMSVRLTTFPVGVDGTGTQAICFGFEPSEVDHGR